MSRIAVIGAGVVGVASAWELCRLGHEVTLVDRLPGPGQGVSAANGAQLSYAFADALASPAFVRHLPGVLTGRDPAYRVRLQSDPEFLVWGLRFLWNARATAFAANTRANLEMARDAADALADLLAECPLSFDHAPSGKMILYSSAQACAAGEALRAMKRDLGFRQEILSREEATAVEPALAQYPDPIARVLWSPDDAAGAPDRFCVDLVETLRRRYGLRTRFGADVVGIVREGGSVRGLRFRDREDLACDRVVVATGADLGLIPLRERGWGTLWPVQGYSLTVRATDRAMRVSITDLSRKMVFARLGDRIRVAGFADIGPRSVRFDPQRFERFRLSAAEAFGASLDAAGGLHPWSGGRPCTPSSRPIVASSSVSGLYLNIGHGTLGWTLCLGAARKLGRLVGHAARGRRSRADEARSPAYPASCS